MIVGVPKEIKRDEYRVAMLPVGVEELVPRRASRAGRGRRGARFRTARPGLCARAGAELVDTAAEIFRAAT